MDPERLDEVLPQWQCRQCGYEGCRPYAEALAHGETTPDRCRPGGLPIFLALAERLDLDPEAFTPPVPDPPKRAHIDPGRCIGCARCLPACPVDAILGARHYLHEVLFSECTGCGLCIAPCPTDCIRLVDDPTSPGCVSTGRPGPMPDPGLDPVRYQAAWLKYRYERHRSRFGQKTSPQPDPESPSREDLLAEIRVMVEENRARQVARRQALGRASKP
jgi:RnfABCDGE-type electron transport complex B subunit